MHIKIHIPPKRATHTRGYGFPTMSQPQRSYTVPLSNLLLKQEICTYSESEYDDVLKKYYDVAKELERYYISSPALKEEWAEIHPEEYARVSKALGKLNLTDIEQHNEKASKLGSTEKQVVKSDMNALFGIDVTDEIELL